jgi:hypothetical protein
VALAALAIASTQAPSFAFVLLLAGALAVALVLYRFSRKRT